MSTDPKRIDELAAIIEQSDFAEESAELAIEAGWMHPDDAERLANIGMSNCDSALDWKDRAEAAEAKIARVEALAESMQTWSNHRGLAVDYASRIRAALAEPERNEEDSDV